jgi:hypothetical protein
MPVSTKIFEIETFPEEFPIETTPVIADGVTEFELRTSVRHLGVGEYAHKDLIKLLINHDRGKKFEGVGYSEENGRIEDLISIAEEKEFPAFVFPEKNYLISAFSAKEIYNQAFRRLRQYYNALQDNNKVLKAKPVKIDLQKLKESYDTSGTGPSIRGGWFKNLRITNVDVAYIGGGGVDGSDEWFKYENSGTISALRLDFPQADPEEEPHRFMLTNDGSIYCYKTLSENELLNTLVPIYEYIIQFKE